MRSIYMDVRNSDWKNMLGNEKLIHQSKAKKEVQQQLNMFITKFEKKYPKAVNVFSNNTSLFTFYGYT